MPQLIFNQKPCKHFFSALSSPWLFFGLLFFSLSWLFGGQASATTYEHVMPIETSNNGNLSISDYTGIDTCVAGVTYNCYTLSSGTAAWIIAYTVGGSGAQTGERWYHGIPGDSWPGTAWATGGGHNPPFNNSNGGSATSADAFITIMVVHTADEAAADTFMATGAGAPTDFAYKTYYINFSPNTDCEGTECADYDPENDSITPTNPLSSSVQDNTFIFTGSINISTSTAALGTGSNTIKITLERYLNSQWVDLDVGASFNGSLSQAGKWFYGQYTGAIFTQYQPDGTYRYSMQICHFLSIGNMTCSDFMFDTINFTVDHETYWTNLEATLATGTPSWYVKTARDVGAALFKPSVSMEKMIDIFYGTATSSFPVNYLWTLKRQVYRNSNEDEIPSATTTTWTTTNPDGTLSWTFDSGWLKETIEANIASHQGLSDNIAYLQKVIKWIITLWFAIDMFKKIRRTRWL